MMFPSISYNSSNMVWIIGILIVLCITTIFIFNRLITLKNRVFESSSDIEAQLKRRYDLIPNLVEVVKGYAKHEKEVFENITRLRTEAMNQGSQISDKKVKVENDISSTLKSIFALSEDYPDLKANQNFLELQKDIVDTEDKLLAARRFYNSNVMAFNTTIQVFPNNMISTIMGFHTMPFFKVEKEEEREQVHLNLSH